MNKARLLSKMYADLLTSRACTSVGSVSPHRLMFCLSQSDQSGVDLGGYSNARILEGEGIHVNMTPLFSFGAGDHFFASVCC